MHKDFQQAEEPSAVAQKVAPITEPDFTFEYDNKYTSYDTVCYVVV